MLFLLSAAPIGLGCVIVSDDTDTEAATTTSTTAPTSTTAETDPTAATEVATTEAMTTSATGDTTEGPADTTEGPADTTDGTTGGNVLPGCEMYADLVSECYMDEMQGAATLNYCIEQTAYYEMYGPECVGVFEDYLACLSAITCEVLMSGDPVCEAELEVINTTCFPK